MDWLTLHASTVIGAIWMLVLGPAVGNYACSVVYRLPLGRTPFEQHPFCGHCHAALQPIDLFPIISYVLTRGKCRYCGGTIPGIYTVIELACLTLFMAYFFTFGMGQQFLLATAAGVFVIIAASIHYQQGWLPASIYSYAWLVSLTLRTLQEGTIYPAIQGMVLAFVSALLLHAAQQKLRKKTPDISTPWIWWAGLFGMLVPVLEWQWFIVPLSGLLIARFCKKKAGHADMIVWPASLLLAPVLLTM
jgi:prepilin signal peptidase PulO-like enzyme (type II secretory pathway)